MPDLLGHDDLGEVVVDHGIELADESHPGFLQIVVIRDVVDVAERVEIAEAPLHLDAAHQRALVIVMRGLTTGARISVKTSTFTGMVGQRVASKGVTVVDDGTIKDRRGSITVDDEGTPSAHNVLIEDGILVGYMQDRQNARLMGVKPTGNGRRQSFAHVPMPRMTNTYMLGGKSDPKDILADLTDGIYAVGFGGGQVDITNGKFVFSCTEAYRVKNGKVGAPIKGATLIGDGATALKKIRAVGNDMALDPGMGNCGKQGQWVPVGVGQPTLMIGGLTVGGASD